MFNNVKFIGFCRFVTLLFGFDTFFRLLIEALMIGCVFYVRVRKKVSAAECLVNYLQISILAVPQINDTSICSFSLMSLIFTIFNGNT